MPQCKHMLLITALCWIPVIGDSTVLVASPSKEPIHLAVYYESHCPDSKEFISKQVWPTYKALADIMEIELVPFGFAREVQGSDSTYFYTCQHGPEECRGNLIQKRLRIQSRSRITYFHITPNRQNSDRLGAMDSGRIKKGVSKQRVAFRQTCAIKLLNDTSKSLPFISCMESKRLPYQHGEECAKKEELDYEIISNCVRSKNGSQLQHEMAIKTKSLDPPMYFVPWIVINGNSDKDMQDRALYHLLNLICSLCKDEKPKPCTTI